MMIDTKDTGEEHLCLISLQIFNYSSRKWDTVSEDVKQDLELMKKDTDGEFWYFIFHLQTLVKFC